MIAPDHDLDALFKRLHLPCRRVWRISSSGAERILELPRLPGHPGRGGIAHRQQTRLAASRGGALPLLKTIDDFNFAYQTSLRLTMLGSALAPDFVTEGRSLIFTGKPGRGKTHLAIAIAYRAIQHGFDAYFTTAATLIDDLSAAFRAGQTGAGLGHLHPSRDLGGRRGGVPHVRHRRRQHALPRRQRTPSRKRSMIFTTNKSLKARGRCCTTTTWPRLSWTACSNADGSFVSMGRPSAPCTSILTRR